MAIVSVHIPQIGEGLQEARLVAILKQPGDFVKRDEPIYQMETDKAVMDVESPFEGTLVEWMAPVDTILLIGAEVARMETATVGAAVAPSHSAPAPTSTPVAPDANVESIASLRIPMIGEGLQEARLVAILKQAGDFVKRDEPIYQMETDKAIMDVESPYEGTLIEWLAPVDTVLTIGAEVARMKVKGTVVDTGGHGHGPAPSVAAGLSKLPPAASVNAGPLRNSQLPPKTRQYAMQKGLTDADLMQIAASGEKILPETIDAYLSGGKQSAQPMASSVGVGGVFSEKPVAPKQRLLASRLVRGTQLVVAGTISVAVDWEPIETLRAEYKAQGGEFQPSTFTMFAYAVTKSVATHPMFRSTLRGDEVLRTYEHLNLGIAVALPGDELVLAVVEAADTYTWTSFANMTRERIGLARDGKDQANESVTLSLTNMQSFGLRDAVPVVVPPAVGTLFLGEAYNGLDQKSAELKLRRYANIALTFDHRMLNGVAAAEFIQEIKANVEQIASLIHL